MNQTTNLVKDWLRLSPRAGGAGVYSINISTIESNLYGRGERCLQVIAKTTSGEQTGCIVTQSGYEETVKMEYDTYRIGDGESSIILYGESNSQAIKVTLGDNATGVSVSSIEISTNGGRTWTTITNNTDIANDPGLTDMYKFRITLALSSFTLTSGDYLEMSVRGKNAGEVIVKLEPSNTHIITDPFTFSVSSNNPLVILGTSNSSSFTIGGTITNNRSCEIYVSFDEGATWLRYAPGTLIKNQSNARGDGYKWKVVVDTTGITAETDAMTLRVYDNSDNLKDSVTVSFTE